jgi:8-oxo-dGTP pyrophosphatase MutT (NUDIX family)
MLTFHAPGDWGERDVAVAWGASSRQIVPDVEAAIERAWAEASRRPGVMLFDGPMCRLESWQASPARLSLVLSRTSYKPFLGTNLSNPQLADRYGKNILANPVGVSPALETADGFLLLGRRNASVAYYPGRVHPFAGALDPDDGVATTGGAPNVFTAVRRELAEELSLAADDIDDIRCTGIVEDRALRQPELIFRVTSTRTRTDVEAKVDRAEHHATCAVPATSPGVESLLSDAALTPVAVASLLLWGRARWGVQWFDAACEPFVG